MKNDFISYHFGFANTILILVSSVLFACKQKAIFFFCRRMQFNKQAQPEFSSNLCANTRIDDLKNKLYFLRRQRLKCFVDKYSAEVERLSVSGRKMQTLNGHIAKICNQILQFKFSPSLRSEAVIFAILRNTFSEIKGLDDLFVNVVELHDLAEIDCKIFVATRKQISYDENLLDAFTKSEGILTDLYQNVVHINELVSEVHERCFQFLCILEDTLQRIKIVLKQVKIINTTNAVVV